MLKSKSFVKKTRKGKVLKIHREHYLRNDIGCGVEGCEECENPEWKLSKDEKKVLVLDTNAVLHQIDVLECDTMKNVVILSTVLEEVKHRNSTLYNRLREIISKPQRHFYVFTNEFHKDTYIERLENETPNDRNDRAIRVATKWYAEHLPSKSVLLITNDKENLQKALKENLNAQTIHDYIKSIVDQSPTPENIRMFDMLVEPGQDMPKDDKQINFQDHLSPTNIEIGLKNGTLHQGPLRMNRDNFSEGRVFIGGEEEILISGIENLNRSINGDIVAIEIFPEDQWKRPSSEILVEGDVTQENVEETPVDTGSLIPTGKVVGIIKKNWKPYCGSLDPKSIKSNSPICLFIPCEGCIPKIRIRTRQADVLSSQRIVVCIDDWPKNSRYPTGHYVKTLGPIGDKETETEVLLIQHDIPYYPFPESVLNCLPSSTWTADSDPDSKSKHRKDLRDVTVFSVDPPGCTDIDDALHIKELPNGNFECGVHIADVTHFVQEDTAIDREAAKRGSTIYLVNRRIDMLPKLLGENLCSLREQEDRFAFSVIWELTADAKIVNVTFTKSIIRSRKAFTYEEAQNRIDDIRLSDEITVCLRNLNRIAKVLKSRRIEDGALTLASPEVKFVKDEETQDPIDIEMYQTRDTNSMVEEFMLLANISTAKMTYEKFPNLALLRRHPPPNSRYLENLDNALQQIGHKLDFSSSKALAESLDQVKSKKDPYLNTLVRIMTTRCMSQAVYFSSGSLPEENFSHYGLATPIYTHFTSPIRRYADVIVHRLLGCAIGVYSMSMEVDNHRIRRITDEINYRHRMAQFASRSSVELHTLIYFKEKVVQEDAYVMRVKSNGFSVIVPKYGIEGLIYLGNMEGTFKSSVVYDDKTQILHGPGFSIRIFQRVRVEISVDAVKHRVQLKCIQPPLEELLNQKTQEGDTSSTSPMPEVTLSPITQKRVPETEPGDSPAKKKNKKKRRKSQKSEEQLQIFD